MPRPAPLRRLTGAEHTGPPPGASTSSASTPTTTTGSCCPFAIQHRTHVALTPRDDGVVRVASTFDDARPSRCRSPSSTSLPGAARRGRRVGARIRSGSPGRCSARSGADAASVTGVDLAFTSDVPVGAGLSSSAAIEGADGVGAQRRRGSLGLDRVALAQGRPHRRERGRRRPDRDHGPDGVDARPGGCRDLPRLPLARGDGRRPRLRRRRPRAARDGHRREALARDRRLRRAPRLVRARRRDHGRAGAARRHRSTTCRARPSSWTTSPSAACATSSPRTSGCSTPCARCASTGPTAIGDLLVASHASMRDDFEISVPELDTAVEAALAVGRRRRAHDRRRLRRRGDRARRARPGASR